MNAFVLLMILQGTPAMQSFETKDACETALSWMQIKAYNTNTNWRFEGKCIPSNEPPATPDPKK